MGGIEQTNLKHKYKLSLKNPSNEKGVLEEFLELYKENTSATLGTIIKRNIKKCSSVITAVGDKSYLKYIINEKPDYVKEYHMSHKDNKYILYLKLKEHCMAFVYEGVNLNINAVAELLVYLKDDIEVSLDNLLSYERILLSLSATNNGLWDWDLVHNSIYFSPRFKSMLGFSDEELKNDFSSWKDRVHPSDIEQSLSDIEDNVSGKTEYYENIHRLKHKDGHWVWILDKGKTYFDNSNIAIRMIGVHIDITKEKNMELKLEHQSQIISQIHDSIITTDCLGKVLSYNKGSKHLFEHKSSDIIGENVRTLIAKGQLHKIKKILHSLRSNNNYSTELKLITKSKKIIYTHIAFSHLKDENFNSIGMIGYTHDISDRKKAEKLLLEQKSELLYQANHDSLTGLANRTLFKDRLEQTIHKAKRYHKEVALLFIDLDYFKEINDTLGHNIGDEVLKVVSTRLIEVTREEDTIARLGGDEFTIIAYSDKQESGASLLADKILNILSKPILIKEHRLHISASIGISLFPQDATDYTNLVKYADIAMYKAKDSGKHNFQFYSKDLTKIYQDQIVLKNNLIRAIKDSEFTVYYQSQIDSLTNSVIGVEALVRWNHPKLGIISPAVFLKTLDDSGLIVDVDTFVLKESMQQMMIWKKDVIFPNYLSVNISIKQITSKNFIDKLKNLLDITGFNPKYLNFEISEDQLMLYSKKLPNIFYAIHKLGCKITIDNFGIGCISLLYIHRIKADKIKIDKSLVKGCTLKDKNMDIAQAIIVLAEVLHIDIIAEGIETVEQKHFLSTHGCTHLQGYLYSKPLPADKFEAVLSR